MTEWGDSLDFLYDLESSGVSPQALQNQPILHNWMKEYLEAFRTLNKTRQNGMAPCPISLQEIKAYLELYGAYDITAFIDYILKMDVAYLNQMAKKSANTAESSKPRGTDLNGRQSSNPKRQRRPVSRNGR